MLKPEITRSARIACLCRNAFMLNIKMRLSMLCALAIQRSVVLVGRLQWRGYDCRTGYSKPSGSYPFGSIRSERTKRRCERHRGYRVYRGTYAVFYDNRQSGADLPI